MQPVPIHHGDRTPAARLPSIAGTLARTLLKAAIVGALAFAGWFLLSTMAGPAMAADTDGGVFQRVDGVVGDALGSVTSAAQRTVLTDAPVADRVLPSLAIQDGSRVGADDRTAASASKDEAVRPQQRNNAKVAGAPRFSRDAPTTTANAECGPCDDAEHGPTAPQPHLPPADHDTTGLVGSIWHGPGPVAGMLPPLTDTEAPAEDARSFPATTLKDESAPARPMVVPD